MLDYMKVFWGIVASVAVVNCGRTSELPGDDGYGGASSSDGGAPLISGGSGGSARGGDANTLGGAGGNGTVAVQCQTGSSRSGDIYLKNQSDVDLLGGVTQVDGSLHITDDVADLGPLGCLREVTGSLKVYEAKVLKDLAGLEGLTTIGKALVLGTFCDKPQAMCVGNPALESVSGLGNVTHLQNLTVGACNDGEGAKPCGPNSALVRVELNGLPSVESISVTGSPNLTEVSFGELTRATSIQISSNSKLRALRFPKLASVETLSLWYSEALEQFVVDSGIEAAKYVEISKTGLTDLGWLKLKTVSSLRIMGNPRLLSLDGLQQLQTAGSILLDGNTALTTLEALSALISVEHELYVTNNPGLTSLTGLDGLMTAGRLYVDSNDQLSNLKGLSSLVTLRELSVLNNPQLASLEGLESLTALGSLSIRDNPRLAECEAERLGRQIGSALTDIVISGNNGAGACTP
ncbi:MAG TPA: hypothetical protein VJV79_16310 [Polyangiaceae bacterium]|nr:hypothetical protein [Polyangiaceae bacterium]